MSNQGWQVWICGKCRRRVPGQFLECRCGGLKAQALGTIGEDEGQEEGGALWPKLFGAVGIGAVLAGSWLWFSRSPDAVRSAGPLVTPAPLASALLAAPGGPRATPQFATPGPPLNGPGYSQGMMPPSRINTAPPATPPAGGWPTVGTPAPPAAAAAETPPPTPYVSEPDRMREAGRQRLRGEFQAMHANAVSLVTMVTLFEERCRTEKSDECTNLGNEIGRMAVAVGAAIERTEDIARTSYLEPGVVREMRAAVGMEDSFWDELERVTREYRR